MARIEKLAEENDDVKTLLTQYHILLERPDAVFYTALSRITAVISREMQDLCDASEQIKADRQSGGPAITTNDDGSKEISVGIIDSDDKTFDRVYKLLKDAGPILSGLRTGLVGISEEYAKEASRSEPTKYRMGGTS